MRESEISSSAAPSRISIHRSIHRSITIETKFLIGPTTSDASQCPILQIGGRVPVRVHSGVSRGKLTHTPNPSSPHWQPVCATLHAIDRHFLIMGKGVWRSGRFPRITLLSAHLSWSPYRCQHRQRLQFLAAAFSDPCTDCLLREKG